MSFFTSPIPHQHQNNHHYNGDEQHQFPERKVWDFPQVVEAKIEERSVYPNLGVIEISIMYLVIISSLILSSYHHMMTMTIMMIYQGVILDAHDRVVGEVDKGDVH